MAKKTTLDKIEEHAEEKHGFWWRLSKGIHGWLQKFVLWSTEEKQKEIKK